MRTPRTWIAGWIALAAVTLPPALACAGGAKPGPGAKAQTVEVSVTDQGFVFAQPNPTVKVGQPVKMVLTRKTDQTCVKEIVLQEYGINQPLPLNKPVEVTFTPKKAGPVQYSCGMGMSGPTLVAK